MFAEKIINWYHENGRNLPWRCTDNPYYIWLSEIILQQTRIEQGRAYYEHFITRYPTVQHLADATEEQVLKSWQGLGYYSRARNLHTAARHIAYDLHGVFPCTYKEILALKGVGRYTAAAIASFAFRLPYPVIDGNVYRLIARLYGIHTPIGTTAAQREFENLLNTLIDPVRPDLFNQAIMDFGSIQCKPTGCDCANCIFSQECTAHKHGQVALLPVKPNPPKVKERHFYYFDIRWPQPAETMLIHQRSKGDIWQGLYELPLLETDAPIPQRHLRAQALQTLTDWLGTEPATLQVGPAYTHQLTHRTIKAQFLQAKYPCQPAKMPQTLTPIYCETLKTLPISRLIDRYLSEM